MCLGSGEMRHHSVCQFLVVDFTSLLNGDGLGNWNWNGFIYAVIDHGSGFVLGGGCIRWPTNAECPPTPTE